MILGFLRSKHMNAFYRIFNDRLTNIFNGRLFIFTFSMADWGQILVKIAFNPHIDPSHTCHV